MKISLFDLISFPEKGYIEMKTINPIKNKIIVINKIFNSKLLD
jgi:hypothetical protein